MYKESHTKIGLGLAVILLVVALIINSFNSYTTKELCENAQSHLRVKEKQALDGLEWLDKAVKPNKNSFIEFNEQETNNIKGISLFAFVDDTLNFWNTNLVPLDVSINDFKENNGFLRLRNGWYEYFLENKGKLKKMALIFIKPDFDVQNNYFDNRFASWLELPSQSVLRNKINYLPHTIKSINNVPLFEISVNEQSIKSESLSLCSAFLFFLSMALFLFLGLRRAITSGLTLNKFLITTVSIIAIRLIMIYFKWPGLLYNTALFAPEDFGNTESFFNSFLGDIIINVILFLAWSIIFFKAVHWSIKEGAIKIVAFVIYFSMLIGLALYLNITVKNLVFNSTIPFEFSNFFNLNALSFLCLSIVFINGLSIAVLIEKFIDLFFENQRVKKIYLLLSCFCVYGALYLAFEKNFSLVEWFWLPALLFVSVGFRKFNFTQSILSAGFKVLLFALITSWLFSDYNSGKETQNMLVLADKLSDKQDAVLEGEFSDIVRKIKKDLSLSKALHRLPLYSNETEQKLRQNYFTRYFEKYNVRLAVFDSVCMPYFKNSDLLLNNNEYFEDQIKLGMPTLSENLFFMDIDKGKSRYLGKIEFAKREKDKAPYTLYVELEPKQFAEAGSFPDLLLDEGQQKQNKYKQISYAVYKQNKLTAFYGAYDYPMFRKDSTTLRDPKNKFKQHFVMPDPETFIVLSLRIRDFNYYFTTNSYYFIFYSLLGLVLLFASYPIRNKRVNLFSLDRRIQVFTISILFFALLAVGVFTVKLVIDKSEGDHIKQLTEKASQIRNELNLILFNANSLEVNGKQYAEGILKKYAGLFNTDISLYNPNGILFASSRPQLFDAGLSSKLINPSTITNFYNIKSSNYSTYDKIGLLKYLSLYTPLYNVSGDFIGYMNLPYFARQSDLEEGLSDYITTLLNVYVVLFLISLFTGLVVTTYVTKPLRIIQQQLAKISLGKKNEPIEWKSKDEIGKLVKEYNQMLLKIEESAVLLAKSEREGAWQEMAKQVAHEIKNPLTPMKLNLQYLQKVVNEGGTDLADKFKNVSSSIIEQIDTLAHIANEFSNFAKMPKVNLEKVNLKEVIQSTIELFNSPQTRISFDAKEISMIVLADKNQCLRVFNNLIKNAIQAIPDNKKGEIEIVVKKEGHTILVSIKDNGIGIPKSMHKKIFAPNFTTKSTGTGLGLAMVKNIINSFGGEIWFESNENEGTIFYLTFQE